MIFLAFDWSSLCFLALAVYFFWDNLPFRALTLGYPPNPVLWSLLNLIHVIDPSMDPNRWEGIGATEMLLEPRTEWSMKEFWALGHHLGLSDSPIVGHPGGMQSLLINHIAECWQEFFDGDWEIRLTSTDCWLLLFWWSIMALEMRQQEWFGRVDKMRSEKILAEKK